MNSLNIISARVTPQPTPSPSRSNSLGHVALAASDTNQPSDDSFPNEDSPNNNTASSTTNVAALDDYASRENYDDGNDGDMLDFMTGAGEKTPLLGKTEPMSKDPNNVRTYSWHVLPARLANNLINSIRWILSTIATPGVYLIACFYDQQGYFAPLRQIRTLFGLYAGDARAPDAEQYDSTEYIDEKRHRTRSASRGSGDNNPSPAMQVPNSSGSSSSGLSSESESDVTSRSELEGRASSRHTRSKSTEEIAPARRSIRIKLHSEDALRQRKHKKSQSASPKSNAGETASGDLATQLKSPTSPVGALTKYPKTPAPPRPLIPRRQPSFISYENPDPSHLKTLILDLDETLIHSMSRGGRIGSGHMVEVRLNTTYVGAGGQQSLGPQHPILYYVHKRPHCDEFLRKVSKWFNLVVFTASVQEYADPVIDWLESERKFFTGRFYRQHCTFRHGAFIKDLSSVEPDLSKVMILDNSPLSYMFHQGKQSLAPTDSRLSLLPLSVLTWVTPADNAIPIQGWISDPTDNDLLHLVPLLEGLQYVSDVRALLALRGGEDGQHQVS
ncbi:dullard-like phosphatase [Apiospora saccharicola]|uniref:Dullard-like phosphatase n=1 Tax=Apiospora saccharicola TaxID=335842 RepID=A0ABR1WEK4_9PEZI